MPKKSDKSLTTHIPKTTTLEEAQAVGVITKAYPHFNPDKWVEFDMIGHSGIAYVLTEGVGREGNGVLYGVTVAEIQGLEAVPRPDLSLPFPDYAAASVHVDHLWQKFGEVEVEVEATSKKKSGKSKKP